MAHIGLRLVNGKWIEDKDSPFKLDELVKQKLDNIKDIVYNKNFDAVILFDGIKRAGKSTFAMMCGHYLSDGKITLNNFARGLSDAAKKIQELPDRSVLIMDEAGLIFNGKDSNNREVKALLKLMDVVGQKNMIFLLCTPSFFALNRQIACREAKFLIRVSVDKEYNRGTLLFWGERSKSRLYREGKKKGDDYGCVPYDFAASYNDYYLPFYDEYKETIKKESLAEVLDLAVGNKKRINNDTLIEFVYNTIEWFMKMGKSQEEIASITGVTVAQIKTWRMRYSRELGIEG